jgi:tetratricopeptide (TPR) repeat protein
MLEIVTVIGSKILDLTVDKIVDRLGDHLEPQMRLIDQSLESIEEKVERELAIHLNAALIFLQSKAHQSARHELVMAVAADPHAAAAKFWYAVVLYMDGERELARSEYAKALLLNPFLGQNADSAPDALHGVLEYRAPLVRWTVKLNEKRFIKKYLWGNWIRKQIASWSGGGWGFREFAAIEKISCSGGNPVIFWRVGSNTFLFMRSDLFIKTP